MPVYLGENTITDLVTIAQSPKTLDAEIKWNPDTQCRVFFMKADQNCTVEILMPFAGGWETEQSIALIANTFTGPIKLGYKVPSNKYKITTAANVNVKLYCLDSKTASF